MKRNKEQVNIFMKSVLRQPVRSLILFLLVGLAAFAFVMRTTEFLAVRGGIYQIAAHYRAIGFLHVAGTTYGNVQAGADLIAGSELIDFEDRRRGAEALLHYMPNANFAGRADIPTGGHILWGMEATYRAIPERQHYAYFYGTVQRVRLFGRNFIGLDVLVDHVVVGYPEQVTVGRVLQVQNHMPCGGPNPVEHIEVGQRLFMRAAQYWASPYGRGTTWTAGASVIYMRPLNENFHYIYIPYGYVDFDKPGMEDIADNIVRQQYNISAVQLRTTADMTAMPLTQELFDRVSLVRGRFIDHDDYLNARPVAVIGHALATARGINIGDSITVSIPGGQRIVDLQTVMYFGFQGLDGWHYRQENFIFGDGIIEMVVLGDHLDEAKTELTLEVVGTYVKLPEAPDGAGPFSITGTLLGNYIYIPDSVLPAGVLPPRDEKHGYENFQWDIWYNFVLADTRYENRFVEEYGDALAALGINLSFVHTDAANFWASAEHMLLSASINAVLFWLVLIVVLSFVTFIYLGQRRRDFAISRALGIPMKKLIVQLLSPLYLISLPFVVAGGVAGWLFANNLAAGTLAGLEGYEAAHHVQSSVLWLLLQFAVILAAMSLMALISCVRTAKQPVLELLQNSPVKANKVAVSPTVAPIPNLNLGILTAKAHDAPKSAKNIFFAGIGFIGRHILRAPAKSALTVLVALFIIFAFAVFASITRSTHDELDRLYSTTFVSGEITGSRPDLILFHDTMNDVIQTGYFYSYYFEATHSNNFIIPAGADGNFPIGVDGGDFWDDFARHIRYDYWADEVSRQDPLFAFSDFDRFLERHGEQLVDGVPGVITGEGEDFGGLGVAVDPLEITFGEGFSRESFVYTDTAKQTPIPVILSDLTLQRRGLYVGDTAFIGYRDRRWGWVREQFEYPIIVIGTHNGGIDHALGRNAVLLPLDALIFMRDDDMRYHSLQFVVDPTHNRDIEGVLAGIGAQLGNSRQFIHMRLTPVADDSQLRTVVVEMERTLSLLQLIYPIVISVSVIIGAGLALLIMLQNVKIAAILRVLGFAKAHVRTLLCIGHVLLAICGTVMAIMAALLLGIGLIIDLPLPVMLYLAGVVVGSVAGAMVITRHAPLALLQVKE